MKLSELIKIGAEQIDVPDWYTYIGYLGGKRAGCAIGAAYLGAGGEEDYMYCDSLKKFIADRTETNLEEVVPNPPDYLFDDHQLDLGNSIWEVTQQVFRTNNSQFEPTIKWLESIGQ